MSSTYLTRTYFFFYGSLPPRDLHSFPTRRSSDLARLYFGVVVQAERVIRSAEVLVQTSLQHRARAAHQDRKSTRLNSSHVAISYAVFCLKKKKLKVTSDLAPEMRGDSFRAGVPVR